MVLLRSSCNSTSARTQVQSECLSIVFLRVNNFDCTRVNPGGVALASLGLVPSICINLHGRASSIVASVPVVFVENLLIASAGHGA